MPIELRWLPNLSASCFHLVDAVHRELPIVDARSNELVVPAARQFLDELRGMSLPVPRLLRTFAAWSPRIDSNAELAQTVVSKDLGLVTRDQPQVTVLAGRITELEAALRKA